MAPLHNKLKRRTVRLFVYVLTAVLLLEIVAVSAEFYLSRAEQEHRRIVAIAIEELALAESYERASYLAVIALSTSDWEMLLEQRRKGQELAERFAEDHDVLMERYGATSTDGATSSDGALSSFEEEVRSLQAELEAIAELWPQVVASQLKVLRASHHELHENPMIHEFRTLAGELHERLQSVVRRLNIRHQARIESLSRSRIAVPLVELGLILLLGFVAFRGLVRPLGDTMDEVQASREQLDRAHQLLERRVEERTEELAATNQVLNEQTEVLESVLDSMGEGLVSVSLSGEVRIWNAAAERIIGARLTRMSRDTSGASDDQDGEIQASREVHWSAVCESFHPDRVTAMTESELPIHRALAGEAVSSEMFVRTRGRPDGAWLNWTAGPIATPDGERLGAVAVFRDATQRKASEEQLRQAHDELEARVIERTRKLREAQSQLVDTALAAGKAEVATNILHNVGNVLNGVNVLTQVVAERLEDPRWHAVQKLADLIAEHREDLAHFLTEDRRGKRVPQYLGELAGVLHRERTAIIERVQRLAEQMEHIKRIIHVQQEHARTVSLSEETSVAEVIDAALEINQSGLERHGIVLEKTFEEIPTIELDKHKLLQILINLISNAKHALADRPRGERRLIIRLLVPRHSGAGHGAGAGVGDGAGADDSDGDEVTGGDETRGDHIRIEVTDNGKGIAPELLTRIFQHGFSTRDEGHGFGLHASVLAAKQLGGTLTAHSDGVDRGATFIVELSLR